MAMTKCRECGTEVSTKAEACPKCGAKIKRTSLFTKIVGGFFALVVIVAVWSSVDGDRRRDERAQSEATKRAVQAQSEATKRAAMTSEQRAADDKAKAGAKAQKDKADAANEAAFQRALLLAKAVKASANDPKSIEYVEAFATDDGAVALKFRGKNAFGALILNYAIMGKDGKTTSGPESSIAAAWNKQIAHKAGQDLTSAIRGAQSMGAI